MTIREDNNFVVYEKVLKNLGTVLYVGEGTPSRANEPHRSNDEFNKLVDAGNTVMVIEHNLDVIKSADYIIDLGPEGGDEGGRVITTGTPEEIMTTKSSYTGQFLRKVLPF